MKRFIRRAMDRIDKLDKNQITRVIEELVDENELLEMVLFSLKGGIIVCDKDDNVIFLNKAVNPLLPIAIPDPMEKKVYHIFQDREISKFIEETMMNGYTVNDKECTFDRNGRNLILSISIRPYARKGRLYGNYIYLEDVTSRKIEESQLRRAESLVSLTTMTAGIAHEIKNPLGSMAIYIQLMNRLLKNDSDDAREEMESYLEIMNEEVERLNSIVVDYLFAVRPLDATLTNHDLNRIIVDTLQLVQFEMAEKKIKIKSKLNSNLPEIQMDDKLIKQTFLNLLKNAESAMELGGAITITTDLKENQIVWEISDNGSGMTEEIQSKIFEPYYTTKESGTGLGLTLCYKIIKEHKGEIEVTSKEGQGTTFRIFLPVTNKGENELLEWKEEDNEL